MKKIYFMGASGIIGQNFNLINKQKYKTTFTYNSNKLRNFKKFDIKNSSFSKFLKKNGIPDVIIFGISLSDHDKAASKKNESEKVNYKLIVNLFNKIKRYPKIKLIFLSTQMVLEGKKKNSSEKIKAKPIITYGKQKLKVENFITKNLKNFIIFRLAKVYGDKINDKSLITSFLSQVKKNKKRFIVANDQFFNPLYVKDLIKILNVAIDKNLNGLYHVGGPKRYSRIEILKNVSQQLETQIKISIKIIGKKLNSFNQNEKHPNDTSFNINKLVKDFNIKPLDFKVVSKKIIKKYFKN